MLTMVDAADGLVLVDAHPGNTVNALRAINPAVSNENRPDLLQNKLTHSIPRTVITPTVTRTTARNFKKRIPLHRPSDSTNGLIMPSTSGSKSNRANGSIQTMMTLPLGAAVARRPAEVGSESVRNGPYDFMLHQSAGKFSKTTARSLRRSSRACG